MRGDAARELAGLSRFRVVRALGSGAQGAVYEAIDLEANVPVALKMVRVSGADELLRLKTEFRAIRDLRHPNLVRLGELIEENGSWLFTMELVRGVDVLTYVRGASPRDNDPTGTFQTPTSGERRIGSPGGRDDAASGGGSTAREGAPRAAFDEARLRRVLGELASALAAIHRGGKVHRDVKPSNVLVDASGRVVLIDFGVALELADPESEEGVVGTAAYMAPEQAAGEAVGPPADWYGVGVLLFEALTGRRPFEGSAPVILQEKCTREAPPPSAFAGRVPPDLDALCKQLLAALPEERPSEAEILEALGVEPEPRAATSLYPPRSAPRFVGRRAELDALAAGYERTKAGAAFAVALVGESGVGKTAVAARFVESLRRTEPNVLVLHGRCHEQERVPYNAFDAVVDTLAKHLRGGRLGPLTEVLPEGMAQLARVFPALGELGRRGPGTRDHAGAVAFPPRLERAYAFTALRTLLARVASAGAVVVVLDDVQWADADSVVLLEELTQEPGAPQVLFVLTARPQAEGAVPHAVSALRCAWANVPVGRLSPNEATELVHELARERPALANVDTEAVVASGHGHPMFLEEIVRHVAEHPAPLAAADLDEALWARVERLPEHARALLAVVATAGGPVRQAVVAEAAGLGAREYAEHVTLLRSAKVVRVRGARLDDEIEPFHDRVRETVYQRLGDKRRRRAHLRLALALEGRGSPPEVLYRHFERAGAVAKAAVHAEAAAQAAAQAFAFENAAELYRGALAGTRDAAHRHRLRVSLADALANAGLSREAAETFLVAAAEAMEEDARLDLLRRAAEQFLMGGHLAPGLAATERLLAAFGTALPKSRAAALGRLAWAELGLALRPLAWTRTNEERPRAATAKVDVFWSVGAGLTMVDTIPSALFLSRATALALREGDPGRIARALSAASCAASAQGRAREARRRLAACERAAGEEGSARGQFYVEVARTSYDFLVENDWRATRDGALRAERLWRSTGRKEGWEADVVEQLACWSLNNLGRLPELDARVKARVRAAQRAGNRFVEVSFRTYFVNPELARDRPEEARRDVREAIASWMPGSHELRNQDYLALRSLTYIALYAGDVDEATALLPEWKRFFGSLLSRVVHILQDALFLTGALALARAESARRRGSPSDAKRLLEEARRTTARLARVPRPMARDSALHLRAGLAAMDGDVDRAREVLYAALARSDERGTELSGSCLRRRLGLLVGGDEGKALLAEAQAKALAMGVRSPARFCAALLPGWPEG